MLRSFVGIALPEEIANPLSRLVAGLPAGRAVDPEMYHLTLAFLGEQRETVVEDVHHALMAVSAPGFALRLSGLGLFGDARPRSLHAAVEPDPALVHLRRKIRTAAHEAGIALPRERFVPHVTLARFGGLLEPETVARIGAFVAARSDFRAGPFEVREFVLFRSTLGAQGSVYDALAHYPLGG